MVNYLPKYREAVRHSLVRLSVLKEPAEDDVHGWSRKAESVEVRFGSGTLNAVDAVLDSLAKTEPWHVVEITDTGWTMSHPIVERLTGELLDCAAGGHVGSHETPPLPPGRYRMMETENAWEFFPLED